MGVIVASQPAAANPDSSHQNQNPIQKHAETSVANDEEEEMHRVSRVTMMSEAIIYYRNHHGLVSMVPYLIHLIAEPGFEGCIDDSRVFHTMFKDPKLDPLKVSEMIWADHRPLVLTRLACGQLKAIGDIGNTQTTERKDPFPFLSSRESFATKSMFTC